MNILDFKKVIIQDKILDFKPKQYVKNKKTFTTINNDKSKYYCPVIDLQDYCNQLISENCKVLINNNELTLISC